MKQVALSRLNEFFAALNGTGALYLPVKTEVGDKKVKYLKWTEGTVYSTALNTVRSAKDFFFPQTENLVDFKIKGKELEIIDPRREHEDFILFGVRACDAKSFDVLDRVFLSDPVDSYYASRRDHGTVMTMACTRPAETCFCSTFGIDPAEPAGDVSCWMTEDALLLSANTEKGEALLSAVSPLLSDAEDTAADAQKALIRDRMASLPLASLTTEGFGAEALGRLFDDPKWAELSEACLGCGTCTYVCPTCQCFDIKDFNTNDGVHRFRCWDSCMYSEFTKMSAGQPRLTQLQRFRQRFMHKLVYYPEKNNGMFSCVGCGRCLQSCPISMNIVKVMKALGEEATK